MTLSASPQDNGPSCILAGIPLTPDALHRVAAHFSHFEGTSLLFSGGDLDSAQHSFLYLFPLQTVTVDRRQTTIHASNEKRVIPHQGQPWDALKEHLQLASFNNFALPRWVGYLSWELGAFGEAGSKHLITESSFPLARFHRCAITLVLDHTRAIAQVFQDQASIEQLPPEQRQWVSRLEESRCWLELSEQTPHSPTDEQGQWELQKPLITRKHYIEQVERAQEYIARGDIYQVCLSQQFSLLGHTDPYTLYDRLCTLNPSPFSAYLKCGDHSIVSSSPERFLYHCQGQLETRPIKGTAPRSANDETDAQNRQGLLSSEKEKAELLMITDLMRNDLGRVSTKGSVRCDELWRCEEYTNVFHLVSIIRSTANRHLHPLDILRLSFPAGSISGCPKARALEVIQEIEQRPRGLYTGAIGHIFANGDFDFNVAIRTLVIEDKQVDIQLGGAVVYDSDPDSEYSETLHKGTSIFKALGYLPPK